jgi:hypothetical protein
VENGVSSSDSGLTARKTRNIAERDLEERVWDLPDSGGRG